MKILHLLQSDRFSGAENVVCQIIGTMKRYPEFEMVYSSADGQIRAALEERGIPFVPMRSLCIKEVHRVLQQERPDLIHAHDMAASFFAACVCGKTPLVSHIHNNALDSRGVSAKSIAYLLAAWKARHIFWVARSAYEGYCFHKLFRKKSSVLYNIISVDALYQRMRQDENEYCYDIVFLGRLTYPKDPLRLMRVLAKVVKRRPDTKIAIVGRGELEGEAKALCATLGVTDNISFLGFYNNPLKLLHDAKLMLMTSRWEGLPMCALESLALGVPIVSTPTDGLKELLEDGKNGFVSDDDDVLAERMEWLLSNEQMRSEMSACAKERSRRTNDTDHYCQKLMAVYQKQG